jgi:hypothetical protein
MLSSALFIAVVLVCCFVLGKIVWNGRQEAINGALEARDQVPLEELAMRHYPAFPVDRVTELWTEIAGSLQVDGRRMRPDDRFVGMYGYLKGYPIADDLCQLERAFAARCIQESLDPRAAHIETVDDYMRWFLASPDF